MCVKVEMDSQKKEKKKKGEIILTFSSFFLNRKVVDSTIEGTFQNLSRLSLRAHYDLFL